MDTAGVARPQVTSLKGLLVGAVAILSVGNAAALITHDDASTTVDKTGLRTLEQAAPSTTVAPSAPASTNVPVPTTSAPKNARSKPTSTTVETIPLLPLVTEGYNYEVTLAPTCAQPGQTFTVTFKLKPKWGSSATVMPVYSDGSHENGAGEIAKPDGTVTYSWVAKPVPGEGRLITQARDADTGEYGTKILAFRVVEVNKAC